MSIQRAVAALAASAAAAVMVSAQAGEPVNLAVDMGLWQVTTRAQVKGVLSPQLQEKLQGMPADQRQKIEAAMQAAMAAAQREHVFKECMTPKKLSEGLDSDHDAAQCKSTVVSNTRSEFDFKRVCTPSDGKDHTETVHFKMLDRHHLAGTVDVVQANGDHPMTVHDAIDGKWLASSCGGVTDSQVVK
jgi:Protein of unknown function (DUF3617)